MSGYGMIRLSIISPYLFRSDRGPPPLLLRWKNHIVGPSGLNRKLYILCIHSMYWRWIRAPRGPAGQPGRLGVRDPGPAFPPWGEEIENEIRNDNPEQRAGDQGPAQL